jgi:hypothetical protein
MSKVPTFKSTEKATVPSLAETLSRKASRPFQHEGPLPQRSIVPKVKREFLAHDRSSDGYRS